MAGDARQAERVPPKTRIRRSPEAARAAILEAAREEMEATGSGAVTVSAIMRRAGMRQSNFYHYYPSLDAVTLELLSEIEATIHDAVGPWLEGRLEQADFRAATVEHLSRMLIAGQRHRRVVSAVMRAATSNDRIYDRWRTRIVDYFIERTQRFIEREVAAGRSRVTDPGQTAKALNLMNYGVWLDSLGRDDPDEPEVLGETISAIWNDVIYGAAT